MQCTPPTTTCTSSSSRLTPSLSLEATNKQTNYLEEPPLPYFLTASTPHHHHEFSSKHTQSRQPSPISPKHPTRWENSNSSNSYNSSNSSNSLTFKLLLDEMRFTGSSR
ncbi:hypothetical protein KC19_1G246200 [Ceratodon purpureus]|uniref:Uncharacterized protein n=1 Tax=Ceratodon purpureus TaxID=3225 RepID=A0A8T0JC07_CERPU|nr:hypothetical protein KC19_1G246200 [Ceratodon purpureus]